MTLKDWHGTSGGYNNHTCRCQPCRDAHAAYFREWMRANRDRYNAHCRERRAKKKAEAAK